MGFTTNDYAGLVDEQSIPAVGPYMAQSVSIEAFHDWIVASTDAAVFEVIDGSEHAAQVATLLTGRIGNGYGAASGTVFVAHLRAMYAVKGTIVGVNECSVQFADERGNLHVLPIMAVRGLIVQ